MRMQRRGSVLGHRFRRLLALEILRRDRSDVILEPLRHRLLLPQDALADALRLLIAGCIGCGDKRTI